jgi:GT2 family glycosyltransferase
VTAIDLVIPTFNGRDHLRRCLHGVREQSYSSISVFVVDDGSSDGTVEMMETEFPDAICIQMQGNCGFAAACNAGIGAGSAEYVALLNNDAIPEPDWLERLVSGIERHPRAAAVASKILLADDSGRLHAAGDTFSWQGLPNSRGVWEQDTGQYAAEEEVFSACAAAALYRRAALNDAAMNDGLIFDIDFFMYLEDIDLGWRLRLLGNSVVYIPDARVTHHLSATGGGTLASYYVARNSFAVLAKNLPSGLQRRIWSRFLAHQATQLIEALRHLREPAARARMRGILAGPRFALQQRRKRRTIQAQRRASQADIEQMLT